MCENGRKMYELVNNEFKIMRNNNSINQSEYETNSPYSFLFNSLIHYFDAINSLKSAMTHYYILIQ